MITPEEPPYRKRRKTEECHGYSNGKRRRKGKSQADKFRALVDELF
jgi:hypothetical protein